MKMNKEEGLSRRGFLKTAAAVGTALAVSPALEKVQAATRVAAGSKAASAGDAKAATITAHRTLGTVDSAHSRHHEALTPRRKPTHAELYPVCRRMETAGRRRGSHPRDGRPLQC